MSRNATWTNSDGLVVGFGTREVTTSAGAKVSSNDATEQVVLKIKGTDLADAVAVDSDAIVHGVLIPNDALIVKADLFVTTAFTSGGSAVLDIGLYQEDGTSVDDDGIDAAIAVAALVTDAVVACNGADVGTVTAGAVKVGASYDTAAFTAGEATLVVEYLPQTN